MHIPSGKTQKTFLLQALLLKACLPSALRASRGLAFWTSGSKPTRTTKSLYHKLPRFSCTSTATNCRGTDLTLGPGSKSIATGLLCSEDSAANTRPRLS
ncbi:hypothetical protein EVAR_72943_1 [Eumeta japonica]|uniref:Secreted protein n=1 Tax=Eumeta variegata TaxID=151549 RepID=A0A4C1SRG3_EUMVA|nr:hypothetical protein EVAR_72943_1 [Eumeta japonica]